MIWLAAIAGYALGSIPTAGWISAASGFDIRGDGSRNPGANNARQLGGIRLGATILLVEIVKGAGAVTLGHWLGGDTAAALAGVGAIGGNILNVWYGFSGGQGLGITAGVLLAAWPVWFGPIVGTIALGAYMTRSSSKAALMALSTALIGLIVFIVFDMPRSWGVDDVSLTVLVVGVIGLIAPKQLGKIRLQEPTA